MFSKENKFSDSFCIVKIEGYIVAGVCKLLHWSNYEKTKNVAVLPSEKNVNHFKIHPITILYIGLGKAFNKVNKIWELLGEIYIEWKWKFFLWGF